LAKSGNNIYAGTFGGGVFLSTNFGDSWIEKNNGIISKSINSLLIHGNNIFAGTFGYGVLLSTDLGENWTHINSGLTDFNVYSFAICGEYIFAGSANGVFRAKLSEFELNSVDESESSEAISISPNPATDFIEISGSNYTLKGVVELPRIAIYNMLGECVLSVETQNFVSLQRIDVSGLTEGIYFL
jgi:hypothetical protein